MNVPPPNSPRIPVTEARLWVYISDAEIYAYYHRYLIKPGCGIRSPLRIDRSPSFAFYTDDGSRIYWSDFGMDFGVTTDAIGYVQATPYKQHGYCYDRKTAIRLIWNQLVIGKGLENSPIKANDILPLSVSRGADSRKSDLKPTVPIMGPLRPWELTYWFKRGVDIDLLQFFKAFSLRKLSRKGTRLHLPTDDGSEPFWASNPTWPTYIYDFGGGTNRAFQVYRPGFRRRFYHKNIGSVLFGFDQLPKTGPSLFIVTSMKDVIVLRSLGYAAVAPPSENSTALLLTELPLLDDRFERIYHIGDADTRGYAHSNRLFLKMEEKEIGHIVLASILMPSGCKDPDDVAAHPELDLAAWLKPVEDPYCHYVIGQ